MTANNTNATSEFSEFILVDINERVNQAMTVLRATERGEFKPLHRFMNLTSGTVYVTTGEPRYNEVCLETLDFNAQVEEYWRGYMFDIANSVDDELGNLPAGTDSFSCIVTGIMATTEALNEYGFKYFQVQSDTQAREMTECGDIIAIEINENGAHVFRG